MQSPKQLTRIGIFYLEEAILDAISQGKDVNDDVILERVGLGLPISQSTDDYVSAGDILEKIGLELPTSSSNKRWIINRFLNKLEGEKRVKIRRSEDEKKVLGCKLTASEASRRGLEKFNRNEILADGEIPGPPNSENSEDY